MAPGSFRWALSDFKIQTAVTPFLCTGENPKKISFLCVFIEVVIHWYEKGWVYSNIVAAECASW